MYEKLKRMRKEKGIKIKDLCSALNLKTASAYYKKETGQSTITLQEGKIIADKFNMTIDSLFFENKRSSLEHKPRTP